MRPVPVVTLALAGNGLLLQAPDVSYISKYRACAFLVPSCMLLRLEDAGIMGTSQRLIPAIYTLAPAGDLRQQGTAPAVTLPPAG